jgi:hypothetical protein
VPKLIVTRLQSRNKISPTNSSPPVFRACQKNRLFCRDSVFWHVPKADLQNLGNNSATLAPHKLRTCCRHLSDCVRNYTCRLRRIGSPVLWRTGHSFPGTILGDFDDPARYINSTLATSRGTFVFAGQNLHQLDIVGTIAEKLLLLHKTSLTLPL